MYVNVKGCTDTVDLLDTRLIVSSSSSSSSLVQSSCLKPRELYVVKNRHPCKCFLVIFFFSWHWCNWCVFIFIRCFFFFSFFSGALISCLNWLINVWRNFSKTLLHKTYSPFQVHILSSIIYFKMQEEKTKIHLHLA